MCNFNKILIFIFYRIIIQHKGIKVPAKKKIKLKWYDVIIMPSTFIILLIDFVKRRK